MRGASGFSFRCKKRKSASVNNASGIVKIVEGRFERRTVRCISARLRALALRHQANIVLFVIGAVVRNEAGQADVVYGLHHLQPVPLGGLGGVQDRKAPAAAAGLRTPVNNFE